MRSNAQCSGRSDDLEKVMRWLCGCASGCRTGDGGVQLSRGHAQCALCARDARRRSDDAKRLHPLVGIEAIITVAVGHHEGKWERGIIGRRRGAAVVAREG
uniref:Uncharacterized protein n=1 Tax=Diacronema lutheri TaxID=2081491 RepID=A0A7R9YKH5_DIALT